MRDLTEDIDAVPWGRLKDAYGTSEKTPGRLKRLISSDADERRDAFDELTSTIWHQGSVYEASLHAIPPLAALLKRERVPDPAIILELLTLLGTGSGWHTAHQHVLLVQRAFPADERAAELEKESEIGREIHEALGRYLDLVLALLRAPGEKTRLQAGTLLTLFPERAESLTAPLQEVLQRDESMRVRANTLVLLERLLKEKVAPLSQHVFRNTDDPLLKSAAAIRWATWNPKGSPTEALEWLAGVVETRGGELGRKYGELPAAPEFWLDAANAFALAGAPYALRVLPRYIEMMHRSRCSTEGATGLLLLALCHEDKVLDAKARTFTPEQKRAILAVAQGAWPKPNETFANMCDVLRRFGLPDRQEEMDRLLGLPNADHPGFAGPRDKAVAEYQAKNKPWWKFW